MIRVSLSWALGLSTFIRWRNLLRCDGACPAAESRVVGHQAGNGPHPIGERLVFVLLAVGTALISSSKLLTSVPKLKERQRYKIFNLIIRQSFDLTKFGSHIGFFLRAWIHRFFCLAEIPSTIDFLRSHWVASLLASSFLASGRSTMSVCSFLSL
jgi:hypothetical protein